MIEIYISLSYVCTSTSTTWCFPVMARSAEKFSDLSSIPKVDARHEFHCAVGTSKVCSLECSLKNFRPRISLKRKHSANHRSNRLLGVWGDWRMMNIWWWMVLNGEGWWLMLSDHEWWNWWMLNKWWSMMSSYMMSYNKMRSKLLMNFHFYIHSLELK